MTPAVAAILRRCLAPDPAERYQSARALQDDLERHLAHLPLRHTPEPSWRERVRKWARRHPRVTSASTVAAVAAVVLLGLGGLVLLREERLARVEAADQYRRFQQAARSVQVEFLGAPAGGKSRLAAIETSCRRALELYGADSAADWTERPEVTRLGADVQARLREEVGELLLLLAATVALEEDAKALDFNARALSCSSPDKVSPAVYYQRAALLEQRGRKAEAAQARLQYEAAAPHTPRDQCLLACIRMLEGRARAARPLWEEATRLDPTNLWAWYGLGDCYDRLDKPAQASACYTACIALAPQVHDWHFRRGLAQLRNNEPAAACSDLTVAHRLRPDHRETLVNRALAHLALRDSKAACADLDGAVGLGGADARLYLMRARARDLAGDSAGAASDRQASTHVQPADELAWVARGAGRTASAPEAALADFDQALAHNPRCLAALQSKAHVLAEKLARTEEAIKVLDRAVALYPEHAPARAARGTLLARLGNCDAAHADAAEALAAEPRSPEVVYQVAGIYAQTSRRHPEDRRHALALLAEACRHNFGYDLLTRDADLDPLRDAPEFQRLAQAVRSLQEASSAPDGKAGEGAR
jgi:tetratricopeptide (TPR) repeat protein